MHGQSILRHAASAALVLAFAAGTLIAAPQQAPAEKTAEQIYKNIKVLQGVPESQFLPTMRLFSAALGVDCEFCHVETDRSADTKAMKLMARRMVTMMAGLNKSAFGGAQLVTCYTCHRGDLIPANLQSLPAFERKEEPVPVLPSADQIVSKYIQAVGGEEAIRKVSSRQITATQNLPTGAGGRVGVPAKLEIYRKAPNLIVTTYVTPKFTIENGFDGSAAWAQTPNGKVADLESPYQQRAKRSSDFYGPLDLRAEYARLVTEGTSRVNNRETYVVRGFPQGDAPERLYFDTETGLLLRKQTIIPTIAGGMPAETDYDDYRATASGVKIPFRIELVPASSGAALATESVIQVEKVRENVSIDSGKFKKPASKSPVAK